MQNGINYSSEKILAAPIPQFWSALLGFRYLSATVADLFAEFSVACISGEISKQSYGLPDIIPSCGI